MHLPLSTPLFVLAVVSPLVAHPDLVIDCERAVEIPVVDGDLWEWEDAVWLPFGAEADSLVPQVSQLRDDGTLEPDLSGRLALRWNDTALYLAADVNDNVHDVAGSTRWAWYHRDGVTLFLDVPRDGDGLGWVTGDHAFAFAADPTMPDYGRWWRHGDPEGHLEVPAPAGVRHAVRLTESGYHMEARVPLSILSELTPAFAPAAGREVGFLFLVTDPDGGPEPFGGQIMYGGADDDDAGWSRLRFVPAGTARPPRLEASPLWQAFRARLDSDLRVVGPYFRDEVATEESDSLQAVLGDWYFDRYLAARPSRLATKAVWMAFTLWGNAGDVDRIEAAVARIGVAEDVWEEVVSGMRRGYYRQDRLDEAMDRFAALAPLVVPLKSRSVLYFVLATHWLGERDDARARDALESIVRWRASPWHVNQSNLQLQAIRNR